MIDWSEVMQLHAMRRYVATPLFMEAAGLLCGSAQLWKGRYGAGRLAEARLNGLANRLFRQAIDIRRSSLGWSDPNLRVRSRGEEPEHNDDAVGYLLHQNADSSTYRRPIGEDRRETVIERHPEAAVRLAAMAMTLLETAVPLLKQSGTDLTEHQAGAEARRWEDFLEELGNEPVMQAVNEEPGEGFVAAMRRRAAWREARALCSMTGSILMFADDLHSKTDGPHAARSRGWYAAGGDFEAKADHAYLWFAGREHKVRPDVVASLEAVRNVAFTYSEGSGRHYAKEAQLVRCEEISAALINVLLRSAGIPPERPWEIPKVLPAPERPTALKKGRKERDG